MMESFSKKKLDDVIHTIFSDCNDRSLGVVSESIRVKSIVLNNYLKHRVSHLKSASNRK
jgi:hypothetical protein